MNAIELLGNVGGRLSCSLTDRREPYDCLTAAIPTKEKPMSNPLDDLRRDPNGTAHAAADRIRQLTGVERHDLAVVFGSGWGPAADGLGAPAAECQFTDLPGFVAPTVEGHAGKLRSIQVGSHRVLAWLGRSHRYEFDVGSGMEPIVHAIRTSFGVECRTVILTNAVGGLHPDFTVGQAVMISDHNDLITTAPSPLQGPRFLECNMVYDPRLRRI